MITQRQIKDLVFTTVAEAQASSPYVGQCYIAETETYYQLNETHGGVVNGQSILSTARGGDVRWVAVAGKIPQRNQAYLAGIL
ncbi:MAG: hypothetical protein GWN00_01320 [Aliifodinibius sp.]|nr:hypothetical protein [Fodinibius sp.]NIV09972.1 hypothetical protein [Fodinibius sp.]NIY23502.1 hypothetical protein [Fodinibius sp.]